ncbi:phage tail domain-containing protein [Jeotgalicoccus sp. WY2]|uniref:phage tail domain-containing protein n=1 Tax=Jeotgalicoccus sp. WY2 TaxID=2708346 RepID=UPI001BD4FC9E|nr:phage tail domain-containing protein [Jeotgalicoccus sp. WY2]
MFKIYDLNYKEVNFPVDDLGFGLKSLDINVGPIIYENIYTSSSRADQLVKRYPKDRDVSINAMFTAYNTVDWRLKRDRVYSFFRNLGVFYIAESYQPYKLLKVIVDESYEVDRPVIRWGMLEIPLKIIDTPFKQSLHTTLDIDREGVSWNDKWAYGMGLSSDREQWKYSFGPSDTSSSVHKFRLYNAGTEEIKLIQQKESVITLVALSAASSIEIFDGKKTFRIDRPFKIGDRLTLKGHQIRVNNANVLHHTNRTFLTVKKGWNEWQIKGITNFEFDVDFRFLYD